MRTIILQSFVVTAILGAFSCSGSDIGGSGPGGGVGGVGGAGNSGGATTNGGAVATGGALAQLGGATSTGGVPSAGGSKNTGGSISTGGLGNTGGSVAVGGTRTSGGSLSTGGSIASGGSAATGGAATTGGTPAVGGRTATGGANATGGLAPTGGTKTTGGAAPTGGTSAAVAGSTAGGGTSCPFPTTFKWKDNGGPLATPQNGWVSLKDFTSVVYNGQHIVYMSNHDAATTYGAAMMTFSDWPAAATATQTKLSTNAVAPTLFYFTPKSQWILAYQWCATRFCYATSTNPTSATSWSFGHALLTENITGTSPTGPIDQTVICDSTNCYLFYGDDNGHIYRASMPIANFPSTFSGSTTILTDTTANLFEAVQVYAVKGTGEYLMIVEATGSGRYFRAFRATSLGGTWTAIAGASTQATPFAGKNNVTFTGTAWTNDISHGDLVRTNPDETQTVDPCNLQLLYQGRDPNQNPSYDLLPYLPGLLTKTN